MRACARSGEGVPGEGTDIERAGAPARARDTDSFVRVRPADRELGGAAVVVHAASPSAVHAVRRRS
jgi:hypothetical protein